MALWKDDDLLEVVNNDDNIDNYANDVVQNILKEEADILILVEKLSPVLTNSDAEIRAKGMQLYSSVLNLLPKNYLTESQLKFITEFYIDRLKDNHRVIPPVIVGMLSLINMTNISKSAPAKMLMGIFQHIPCQQQVRVDRYNIYRIIHHSVLHFSNELQGLGPDFVYGVISSFDGERDPRNLILLFSIIPTFLRLIPLGHLVEEMFEIIACYFPVDFTSPKDDPDAISREDLADKLCPCLHGHPGFAEFCVPLLLEKLDSDLKVAKIDSLKLLKASCDIFPASIYEENMANVLSSIQREISHKTDIELSSLANETLTTVVAKFFKSSTKANAENLTAEIIRSSQCLIVEADTKTSLELPLRILLSAGKACPEAAICVASQMIPILTTHFYLKSEEFIKISLLRWFGDVYKLCVYFGAYDETCKSFENLPDMFLFAISEPTPASKEAGFNGISLIGKLIPSESCTVLYREIDKCIGENCPDDNLKSICKNCILALVKENPEKFSDYIESKINLNLADTNSNHYADLLCMVGSEKHYTGIIFNKIIQCLDSFDHTMGSVLVYACLKNFQNPDIYTEEIIGRIQLDYNIVDHLVLWMDNVDYKLVKEIASLIKIITQSLKTENQIELLNKHLEKYCHLVFDQHKEIIIFIVDALLNSLRVENVNVDNIVDIVLEKCILFCLSTTNGEIHEKCCQIIANLLNKLSKTESFQRQYDIIDETIVKHLNESKYNSIILYSWITKGLLLSGHRYSTIWLNKIFSFLMNEKFAMDAAKGVKLIMNDCKEALNSDCYCITNLLYKQKVFHIFMRRIDSLAPEEKSKLQNPAYHLTWAYILQFVPKTTLETEINKVSDILIESLEFDDAELLISSTETISYLMQKKNKTLLASLQTLLPRCIKLSNCKSSMKVRIAALNCLYDIANNISTVNILPYKQDVIYELVPCLDDPKRLVRNAAVRARTRWYLVGSPVEAEEK